MGTMKNIVGHPAMRRGECFGLARWFKVSSNRPEVADSRPRSQVKFWKTGFCASKKKSAITNFDKSGLVGGDIIRQQGCPLGEMFLDPVSVDVCRRIQVRGHDQIKKNRVAAHEPIVSKNYCVTRSYMVRHATSSLSDQGYIFCTLTYTSSIV